MSRLPRNLQAPVQRSPAAQRARRPIFAIAESALAQSEQWLRTPRWRGRESIVYWAGVKREGVWLVTTVIKPHAVTTPGSFRTSAADNARVVEFLSQAGLSLLGQVHTHGGKHVGHSAGDDADAFMPRENSMSVVVPFFGRQGMRPFDLCGVHRYESGRFRRLTRAEVTVEICVVPTSRDFST